MILRSFNLLFLLFLSLILAGCYSSKLNIAEFNNKKLNKEELSVKCKVLLQKELPRLAVVKFTNNTSYGKAQSKNKNSSYGLGLTPIFLGIKNKKTQTKRFVDPKLSESLLPLLEDLLLKTPGIRLYSRADEDKINEELKLQDSGLLDPASLVEFGKTSGVQYLLTGSLNYVHLNKRDFSSSSLLFYKASKESKNTELQFLGAGLQALSALGNKTTVHTSLSIKIIDVRTGEISFSHSLASQADLPHTQTPSYGEIIGGIKKSFSKNLPLLEEEFLKHFTLNTYIKQIRSNKEKSIVQIPLGKKHKIQEGDLFKVYTLEENTDPLNNISSCESVETGVILETSSLIENKYSWLKVKEGKKESLKLLQILKKLP